MDRTGVHEDVRQMGSQIESTWNELKRGMQRSLSAMKLSAENALLTPIVSSTPLPLDPYSYIITRQQAARDPVDDQIGDQYASSMMTNSLTELLRKVVNESDDIDSGKFDQWIERAHMLADSVNQDDAMKLLSAVDQSPQKAEFQPSQIPREKIVKSPKFNLGIQVNH